MTTSSALQPATATGRDADLLARFVKTGDGAAFSKLVERHLGMVFGTACRRTESRELAQEAAQNTFCQLARHAARLRVRESLAPWLHKVAFREAGTLLRSEQSQRRRLRNLADSVAHGEASAGLSLKFPASSLESPTAEHLDAALASLPEAERRVILLRYMQGLSLRELAAAESSSEEAVRKRVSRALDRLTALLARRGVTASAMMGCLTHLPLWPVPPSAGLAIRAVKEAATASASVSLAALAVSSWPMAAVFLTVAIPSALPWGGGGRSSTGMPAFSASPSDVEELAKISSPAGKILTPVVLEGLKRELSLMQAKSKDYQQRGTRIRILNNIYRGDIFGVYPDPFKWAAIQSLIASLPTGEIKAAVPLLMGTEGAALISETLFERWAQEAPVEARQAALEQAERSPEAQYRAPLLGVLRVMARGDFGGTLKWAKDNAPAYCRGDILRSLLQPLAATDPRSYLKWMTDPSTSPEKSDSDSMGAPPSPPGEALCAVLPYDTALALNGLRQGELNGSLKLPLFGLEGEAVVKGLVMPPQAETMATFALDLPPESKLRSQLLITAGLALADSQPARAADLLAASSSGLEDPDDRRSGPLWALLRDWQDKDMNACLAWLTAQGALNADPEVLSAMARGFGLRMPEAGKTSPVATPSK